uniref:XK-related protein n=1 Tax=Trichogramma kaykai TaxID=54128 RepID=A0ABD2WC12_9HYME
MAALNNKSQEYCENRDTTRRTLDLVFYGLTIALFAATIVTDLIAVIEHWFDTNKSWAYCTALLILVPSFFLQLLSLKWYQTNGKLKLFQWISHMFHLAVIHRFYFLLNSVLKSMKSKNTLKEKDWIFRLENDAFTLNLFTSLLVAVPQMIFQLYTMAVSQRVTFWTSK